MIRQNRQHQLRRNRIQIRTTPDHDLSKVKFRLKGPFWKPKLINNSFFSTKNFQTNPRVSRKQASPKPRRPVPIRSPKMRKRKRNEWKKWNQPKLWHGVRHYRDVKLLRKRKRSNSVRIRANLRTQKTISTFLTRFVQRVFLQTTRLPLLYNIMAKFTHTPINCLCSRTSM